MSHPPVPSSIDPAVPSWFREAFTHARHLMGLLSPEGIVLAANQAAVDTVGCPAEAVEGRPFADGPWWRHDADQRGRLQTAIRRAAGGSTVGFLASHPDAAGRLLTVDVILTPCPDVDGLVQRILVEGHDLTEIEEANQGGMWDLHLNDGVMVFSPRWLAMLGYRPGDLPHTMESWMALAPEDSRVDMKAYILDTLARQGRIETETCLRHRDGSWCWRLTTGRVVEREADGTPRRIRGISFDLSARKAVEETLRTINAGLERRVADRTVELDRARAAADAANVAKSRFLASMSHEIRTPMNAILGFAQLIRSDAQLAAVNRQRLDTILRAGDHLLALINDILDVSKIEAGHARLATVAFSLGSLVEVVADIARQRAEAKGIGFRLECAADLPDRVEGDEGKLRQILLNLLGNAVKFTTVGEVALVVSNPAGAAISFAVHDTGPGIDPADQPRLFRPFEQTEIGLMTPGGTGLGLSLSQGFARLMGSEITVTSAPGQGAVFAFIVTLPGAGGVEEETRAPELGRVVGLEHGQVWRVLVVDDRETNRELLRDQLGGIGFQVALACDGAEGLARIADWQPHLVLLDLQMPVLDGFGVLARLKGQPHRPPVIVISANAFSEDRDEALAAGADGFLGKPYREADLMAAIAARLPVRFRREGSSQSTAARPGLDPGRLALLPPGLQAALRMAAVCADLDQLRILAGQVAILDRHLGEVLGTTLDDYRYDLILTALPERP